VRCGFVGHDVKFGHDAEAAADRDTPPSREEAVALAWPAIQATLARYLGPAEYQPSILRLEAIGLLEA
jgi:hypothetical protein